MITGSGTLGSAPEVSTAAWSWVGPVRGTAVMMGSTVSVGWISVVTGSVSTGSAAWVSTGVSSVVAGALAFSSAPGHARGRRGWRS